jgi:chorismate synthase
MFRFTTFGESHGTAIGCVIDGVPPRILLNENDIQYWLDRRKPGQSDFTTKRNETDTVKILSGVFENQTTGTPIGLLIDNIDQRSNDYSKIADQFRPGHADYTYQAKYGIRDYRGGGRASARETAMRVAAGAIARKILNSLVPNGITIRGAMIKLGPYSIDRIRWDWKQVENNPFWCPDAQVINEWATYLNSVCKNGSSIGGVVEVVAENVPVGLGSPVYDKLDADIAKALMSINAVKGVEIGDGFDVVALSGEENADTMHMCNDRLNFLSNHAGGIIGGISTGQNIIARVAIKPTSSISSKQISVDSHNHNVEISTNGRHDPCVAIRGVPVIEAMLAVTLADHLLRHRAQCGL